MIPPSPVELYIKRNEALRLFAYDDATGKPLNMGDTCIGTATCGYGHTGSDVYAGLTIVKDQAEAWFQKDLATALRGAIASLGTAPWLALDPVRRGILTDMAFELGEYGLAQFHRMLAALRAKDWPTAAAELEASKYYSEVPRRAESNKLILLSGEWPPDIA